MIDVEAAKEEILENRRREWRERWRREHYQELGYCRPDAIPYSKIPDMPGDQYPKEWAVHTWITGGIVMDYNAFSKLPKSQQNKIMKQK